MKQMIKTNRKADIIVGILLLLIGVLTLPLHGCKSVKKSQSSSSEAVKVVKSDSSSKQTIKTIDTTETSDATTVTETTFEADSIDYFADIVKGDSDGDRQDVIIYYDHDVKPTLKNIQTGIKSAKGIKITTKVTETAKAEKKGQTIDVKKEQADIKSDSGATKAVVVKQTVKKGWNFAWCWLLLIPLAALVWYKRGWIIEKVVTFLTRWRL